jgi:hypothetical protein
MHKLLHSLKRSTQRVGIKVTKLFNPELTTNVRAGHHAETVGICKQLIKREDTVLLISPISGKKYIKSEKFQLFIILFNNRVMIVNHTYSYTVDLEDKAYERLIRIFDTEVEKRREDMEIEIRNNVKHSLSTIYTKVLANEQI